VIPAGSKAPSKSNKVRTMAKHLNIVLLWLYHFDGSEIFNTGRQRWCVALLAEEKGYDVTVYQKASKSLKLR